jgi:hypothetical protein
MLARTGCLSPHRGAITVAAAAREAVDTRTSRFRYNSRMATQSFENHAHRPTLTAVGFVCVLIALTALGLRWMGIGGRTTFAIGLFGIIAAEMVLLSISRVYTTKLQDRIIRLEMRVRGASVLTPEQQRLLERLTLKQVTALRFASDAEMGPLIERVGREQMAPKDIKRAIRSWTPDFDRT